MTLLCLHLRKPYICLISHSLVDKIALEISQFVFVQYRISFIPAFQILLGESESPVVGYLLFTWYSCGNLDMQTWRKYEERYVEAQRA